MKKILLFTVLLALGFAGGTIMPNVLADSEEAKSAQNCNCGCGPVGTKVMMAPEVSDILLMTGLIEAFAMDSDGSLSKEELVKVMNTLQKEYYETVDLSVVKGMQSGGSESAKSTVSYDSIIKRLFESSKTTNTEVIAQPKQETIVKQSGTSEISIIENKSELEEEAKVKNNNGLGNGSETADNTSIDVKGVDPSNPGKGTTSSKESSTSIVSKKAVITKQGKSHNKNAKKEKVKNNNGLGNGSEPADGTSTDIKGIDPSNPGKGTSKNKAGK